MTRLRLILLALISVMVSAFALNTTPASANSALQNAIRPPQERPVLPNEQTLATTHFLIHYTTSGEHAVDTTDSDGSGVPDYVEAVAESAEFTWSFQIEEAGWVPPPSDEGLGGDSRIDIYLEEVFDNYDAAGYTEMEGGYTGDNPNSPEVERRASHSYISLDDDYFDPNAPDEINEIEYMQSTLAHEFNHAVQAGYDAFDAHSWLYESTATWMEEETYPDLNGGIYFLDDSFGQPDACLVAESGWYGNYAFIKMLSERYGRDLIRTIWENMRAREGFDAVNLALEPFNTSLALEARDYGVAMLLRDYTEGDLYPGVYLEGTANEGEFSPGTGVQSLGVDYIRVRASGLIDVTLNADPDVLTLRAVGIRGTDADVIDAVNGRLTLDPASYDEVYLLVHNILHAEEEDDCADDDYSINVAASSGSPTAITIVRSAANYGDTHITETSGEDDDDEGEPEGGLPFGGTQAGTSTSSSGLDLDFTPIVPESTPAGYTFTSASIWTPEDFGEAADFYMPGAAESANYFYANADDFTIKITESPSPYATLEEWVEDIDYTLDSDFDYEREVLVYGTTEVLIEDLTDDESILHSATLIYNGLFIVIDSDLSREDALAMVEIVLGSEAGVAPIEPTATTFITPVPANPLPTPAPAATPVADVTDDAVIAGLSLFTILICCTGLCIVGLAGGLAAFLLMRRKPSM